MRLRSIVVFTLVSMFTSAVTSAVATAGGATTTTAGHSCGHIRGGTPGDPYTAYSMWVYERHSSCTTAKRVARAWGKATHFDGPQPLDVTVHHFRCTRRSYAQKRPLARCTHAQQIVTFYRHEQARLEPTSKIRNGRAAVVLGARKFAGSEGSGWGTAHPSLISNGGDPSGVAYDITWARWGRGRSLGWAKNAISKPTGGYYRHPARIRLRAQSLGRCSPGGPRAYTKLYFRSPKRPGGKLGPWTSWAYNKSKSICHYGFGD